MSLALVADPASTPVASMLEDLLDQEWAVQSDRAAPLQPTATVRELVELAQGGILGARLGPAASPHELVARLSGSLPETVSPWTLRALRRATALRPPQPRLPVAQEPLRLDPPAPELPPATHVLAPLAAEAPAPIRAPAAATRVWPIVLALLAGVVLGCAATLLLATAF